MEHYVSVANNNNNPTIFMDSYKFKHVYTHFENLIISV